MQAADRVIELALFTAHQTGRFASYSGNKLMSFKDVLAELKPAKPRRQQTPEEMIAAMRAVKATLH